VVSGRLVRARVDAVAGLMIEHYGAVVSELKVDLGGGQVQRTFVGLSKQETLGQGEREFREGYHAAALDAANQIAAGLVELLRCDGGVRP
jgi:hypothetical protein